MKFVILNLCLFLLSFSAYSDFKVSTYNIRNFDKDRGAPTDLLELERIITSLDSDVIAFEEVVNNSKFSDFMATKFPKFNVKISSCGGTGRQKLAIIFNKEKFDFLSAHEDLAFSSGTSKCGSLRPVYFVKLKEKKSKESYLFGVVHLKAGGSKEAKIRRWSQYELLKKKAKDLENENLILLGDFNSTGYSIQDDDYMEFKSFLDVSNLSTSADSMECTSYWNGGRNTGSFYPSILDHIVVSDLLYSQVNNPSVSSHCIKVNCKISSSAELGKSFQSVSDHCPVSVEIKE